MDIPVLVNLDIEAQYIFSVSLYAIKHLHLQAYYIKHLQAYSGLSQISKRGVFENTRNGLKLLVIFLNSSMLDAWLGSKYASEVCLSHVIFNKIG